MWRSVFLHEFADDRLRGYQALAGSMDTASQVMALETDAATGRSVLPLLAGQMFAFTPSEPLREIIGVSMRVRVKGSTSGFASSALFRMGAGVDLDLLIRRPTFGGSRPTDATARAAGAETAFAASLPTLDRYTDIRFDWHTSGQARLWADGALVGYHNALAPGAVLQIDRVTFGLPSPEPDPFHALARRFTVGRVFVRALARPDTLAAVTRRLPRAEPTVDDLLYKCRLTAQSQLLGTVRRLRDFMAAAHQTLSQPWTKAGGPGSGPFQNAAVEAHELAVASGAAFMRMLRLDDYADPDAFLDPFERFLRVLHAALPAQFAALAAELLDRPVVAEECRLVMEKSLDPRRHEFAPLIALLTAASDRVRAIAEGA